MVEKNSTKNNVITMNFDCGSLPDARRKLLEEAII